MYKQGSKLVGLFLVLTLGGCYEETIPEKKDEAPYVPCETICQETARCALDPRCNCLMDPNGMEDCVDPFDAPVAIAICCHRTSESCKNSDNCKLYGACTYYQDSDTCQPGSNVDCLVSESCDSGQGACTYCPDLGNACVYCPTDFTECQQYC